MKIENFTKEIIVPASRKLARYNLIDDNNCFWSIVVDYKVYSDIKSADEIKKEDKILYDLFEENNVFKSFKPKRNIVIINNITRTDIIDYHLNTIPMPFIFEVNDFDCEFYQFDALDLFIEQFRRNKSYPYIVCIIYNNEEVNMRLAKYAYIQRNEYIKYEWHDVLHIYEMGSSNKDIWNALLLDYNKNLNDWEEEPYYEYKYRYQKDYPNKIIQSFGDIDVTKIWDDNGISDYSDIGISRYVIKNLIKYSDPNLNIELYYIKDINDQFIDYLFDNKDKPICIVVDNYNRNYANIATSIMNRGMQIVTINLQELYTFEGNNSYDDCYSLQTMHILYNDSTKKLAKSALLISKVYNNLRFGENWLDK